MLRIDDRRGKFQERTRKETGVTNPVYTMLEPRRYLILIACTRNKSLTTACLQNNPSPGESLVTWLTYFWCWVFSKGFCCHEDIPMMSLKFLLLLTCGIRFLERTDYLHWTVCVVSLHPKIMCEDTRSGRGMRKKKFNQFNTLWSINHSQTMLRLNQWVHD